MTRRSAREVHLEDLEDRRWICFPVVVSGWGRHQVCSPLQRVWKGTITTDQAPMSFSTGWHSILSPSSLSSSSSSRSDGRLQLGQVPLMHAVVAHQLVRAGKLLLTVGPAAGKGLLTWQEVEEGTNGEIIALVGIKTLNSLSFDVLKSMLEGPT